MRTPDRTVYAKHPDGTEVVRYDRAGKWYVERAGDPRIHVSLHDAVREALRPNMTVRLGVSGGGSFDAKYRSESAGAEGSHDG